MKTIKSAAVLFTLITLLSAASSLCAQSHPNGKTQTSAIEVKMIQPGEISLPAEFQVALYEELIRELQKKGGFPKVYRDGDRNAADTSDLVILNTTVADFKQGSELKRDVTTVGGATSITVQCKFTAKDGTVLLERNIDGKVRLIGDNLKATEDFAKKAATVAGENFSSGSPPSDAKKSG